MDADETNGGHGRPTSSFSLDRHTYESSRYDTKWDCWIFTSVTDDRNVDVYFGGEEVALILGYVKPIEALVEDVRSEWRKTWEDLVGSSAVPDHWQKRGFFVGAEGLFALILASKDGNEKAAFVRWICHQMVFQRISICKEPDLRLKFHDKCHVKQGAHRVLFHKLSEHQSSSLGSMGRAWKVMENALRSPPGDCMKSFEDAEKKFYATLREEKAKTETFLWTARGHFQNVLTTVRRQIRKVLSKFANGSFPEDVRNEAVSILQKVEDIFDYLEEKNKEIVSSLEKDTISAYEKYREESEKKLTEAKMLLYSVYDILCET